MPLDDRKIAHIQALLPRIWARRQKTVVFVYNSAGFYSYVAQSVIWRPRQVIDPQIPGEGGNTPGTPADTLMIAPLTLNFSGVVYVADTSTATSGAVAAAPKYEIIECVPQGMIPPGTRYLVSLRRFR